MLAPKSELELNTNNVANLFKQFHLRNRHISVMAASYFNNNTDINQMDMYGNTPLYYSIKFNNKRLLFESILQKGGKIDHINIFGYSPLMYMFLLDRYDYIISLFKNDIYIDTLYQTIQPFDDTIYNAYLLYYCKQLVPHYDHTKCIININNDSLFFKKKRKYKHHNTKILFDTINIKRRYIKNVTTFMLCFKHCMFRTISYIMHRLKISDREINDSNGHNLFYYLEQNNLVGASDKRIIYNYFYQPSLNNYIPQQTESIQN